MNIPERDAIEFRYLLNRLFDELITEDETAQFNHLISENPSLEREYFDFIQLQVSFRELKSIYGEESKAVDPDFNQMFHQLSDWENIAPAMEIEESSLEEKQLIQKVVYTPKAKRKVSKYQIFTLVMSAAAMLFFIVYVKLNPLPTPQQIAVLSNSVNAKWSYPKLDYLVGEPIYCEAMELTDGFVEFALKNGTKLVMEGPARFEFEDSMQVFLEQGKLTAKVTAEAMGYTVRTPSATIVDYGTEFGVMCDSSQTQAHVFSGKVDMRTGSDVRRFEESMRLSAGQAAKIGTNGSIEKIQLKGTEFCRIIPTPYEVHTKSLEPYAYWHFDKKATEPLLDLMKPEISKNRITGDFSWRQGPVLSDNRVCSALGFSGDTGFTIEVPEVSEEEGFTWSLWVLLDSVAPSTITTAQSKTYSDNFREIGVDKDGHFFQSSKEGRIRGINLTTGRQTIQPGRWYHIVLTGKVGLRKQLYVNGQLDALSPAKINPYKTEEYYTKFHFGPWLEDLSMEKDSDFQGAVCEIAFFDYVLTATDVEQLYRASQIRNE